MKTHPQDTAPVVSTVDSLLLRLGGGAPRSIRARLATGAFWSAAGGIGSQALAVVSSMAAARILGPVGFGELGIVTGTIGMVGTFAGLGLGATATKYLAELRETDPARGGRIVGLSIVSAAIASGVAALLLTAAAAYLATKTLNAPHLANELRLGSTLLIFNTITGVQSGALAGLEAFKAIARISFWRGLISVVLLVSGVRLFGVTGGVLAMAATALSAIAITDRELRRECSIAGVIVSYKELGPEWPILLSFSLPAFLAAALTGPAMWLASTVLVKEPNGYVEMGVFNAANQWRGALLFLPQIFSNINMPILASLLARNDLKRTRRVLVATMGVSALVSLPIVAILGVSSNIVMSLYGPAFAGRGLVLVLVVLSIALLAIQAPVGQILTASGRAWLGVFMNLGWAVVLLGSVFVFVHRGWGATGLAAAYLAAYCAHCVWTIGYTIVYVRGGTRLN